MEVCTTLGMLTPEQARQLREAGLSAYNHNLDTSPEYYGKITTSRKYEVSSTALASIFLHEFFLSHGSLCMTPSSPTKAVAPY